MLFIVVNITATKKYAPIIPIVFHQLVVVMIIVDQEKFVVVLCVLTLVCTEQKTVVIVVTVHLVIYIQIVLMGVGEMRPAKKHSQA